jgi:hypothetical protein
MADERKSLYIETTVPSIATARPSNDAMIAGWQVATKAKTDSFHLATCVLKKIDYLLRKKRRREHERYIKRLEHMGRIYLGSPA